jgi:endonuclease I
MKYILRFTIHLFILFVPVILLGQGTYYNSINSASSSFITDLESRIRTPYTRITYDNYKTTIVPNFESRDTTSSRKVITCIYSGLNYVYTPPFAWIGSVGVNSDSGFSREHTWCQSWMPTVSASGFTNLPEYSDQHHLFPVNQNKVNGVRSNHPLGNVVTLTSSYLNGKLGTDVNGKTIYEPRAEHKGDAARALLYMCVRYDGVGGYTWNFNNLNTVTLPGQSSPEAPEDLAALIAWHKQDPPDKWEVDRNTYIETIQKNRNPFVDHPEYVNYIDFNNLSKLSPVYSTEPTNQPTAASVSTITNSSFAVSWTEAAAGTQSPSGYLIEIYNTNTYFIPIDGSSYADDTNLSDGKGIKNCASGTTSTTFTGLTAGTTYYVRLYSYNGVTTAVNYKIDGTIASVTGTTSGGVSTTEPSNYPTNFAQGTITTSSIQLNWTKSDAGARAPTGYLMIASSSPSITAPSDGTVYADDTNLSDNSANVNLDSSVSTYTFSVLPAAATYYFKIFPYTGNGTERNYKTDGSTPTVIASSFANEPTNYPTNFYQGTNSSTSIQLTWTKSVAGSQKPTGYLMIASSSINITAPTDGTVYTDDVDLSDNIAIVNLDSSLSSYTFTGLPSATTYYFSLFPFYGDGETRNYKTDGSPPVQYGLTTGSGVATPSVVVNEYLNGSTNSSEWVELLVLQNNLDLRGMKLRDYTSAGAANSGIIFSTNILWSSVPYGTFIVVLGGINTQTEDVSYSSDKKVIIKATNSTYFSGTSFDITGSNDALELLNSSGAHIYSLGHGPYVGLIANIPQPKASVGGASISATIVRFINVSSKEHFLDSTKVQHSDTVYATQGSWNDTAESTLVVTVLPVELVSFSGAIKNNHVELHWTTATETNNYGFEIERTIDDGKLTMKSWNRIGFVEGTGTTNAPQSYSFVDNAAAGKNAYRLKQIDRDGKFCHSQEIEIMNAQIPQRSVLMQNYPNPFNPATTIRFALAETEHVTVTVYNALGQSVKTIVNGQYQAGTHDVQFDASLLSSGTYFYSLHAGKFSATKSFMLLK